MWLKFWTMLYQKHSKKKVKPPERFELSTPGLQDQCSNHWATEACGGGTAFIANYTCVYKTPMITVGHFHNCNLHFLVLSNLASFKVTTNHSNLWSFQVVYHPSNLLYFKVILAYSNLSSFEYGNLLSYEDFVGFRQQCFFFAGLKIY